MLHELLQRMFDGLPSGGVKTAPATTLEQWLASILGHMEADPGYLDTLPQLPKIILKMRLLHASGVGKPFLMRW